MSEGKGGSEHDIIGLNTASIEHLIWGGIYSISQFFSLFSNTFELVNRLQRPKPDRLGWSPPLTQLPQNLYKTENGRDHERSERVSEENESRAQHTQREGGRREAEA